METYQEKEARPAVEFLKHEHWRCFWKTELTERCCCTKGFFILEKEPCLGAVVAFRNNVFMAKITLRQYEEVLFFPSWREIVNNLTTNHGLRTRA